MLCWWTGALNISFNESFVAFFIVMLWKVWRFTYMKCVHLCGMLVSTFVRWLMWKAQWRNEMTNEILFLLLDQKNIIKVRLQNYERYGQISVWPHLVICVYITNRPSNTILAKIKAIIKTNNSNYQNRLLFMNQPSNTNHIKYSYQWWFLNIWAY